MIDDQRRKRGPEWNWLLAALLLVDAAAVVAAFALAYIAHYHLGLFMLQEVAVDPATYVTMAMQALPVWLLLFALNGLYRCDLLLGGPREYSRLATACTFGFGAIAVLSFLTAAHPPVARGWLVACWPLAIATTTAGRFAARRLAYRLRRHDRFITRTVIVGANAQAVAIARQIDSPLDHGVRVAGFLDDYLPAGATVDERWPVLGAPDRLAMLDVDEAIVVQHALTWESLHELMLGLAAGAPGPAVRLAPTFFDLLTAGMSVGQRANVPVITLDRSRITGLDAVLKAGFEYALSVVLLAALGPLMLALAVRRALTGRPVLERQRFAGVRGRVVWIDRFVPEAGERQRLRHLVEKGPALLSVLRGDVALVGPRLFPAGEPGAPPALLSVRPGLTGPVSVAMARGEPEPEAAHALELSYVRDYSIWRDVQIIWQRMVVLLQPGPRHTDDGRVRPRTTTTTTTMSRMRRPALTAGVRDSDHSEPDTQGQATPRHGVRP